VLIPGSVIAILQLAGCVSRTIMAPRTSKRGPLAPAVLPAG
jgi:hypothetical protein